MIVLYVFSSLVQNDLAFGEEDKYEKSLQQEQH